MSSNSWANTSRLECATALGWFESDCGEWDLSTAFGYTHRIIGDYSFGFLLCDACAILSLQCLFNAGAKKIVEKQTKAYNNYRCFLNRKANSEYQ